MQGFFFSSCWHLHWGVAFFFLIWEDFGGIYILFLTFVLSVIIIFPHERYLTRPVFLFWLWLSLCVSVSVSGIPGGWDQEYFNDCCIWKTSSCSLTFLFMELYATIQVEWGFWRVSGPSPAPLLHTCVWRGGRTLGALWMMWSFLHFDLLSFSSKIFATIC